MVDRTMLEAISSRKKGGLSLPSLKDWRSWVRNLWWDWIIVPGLCLLGGLMGGTLSLTALGLATIFSVIAFIVLAAARAIPGNHFMRAYLWVSITLLPAWIVYLLRS